MDASNERLVSEAVGEIELEDNVLVIRRIHVVLKLKAEESHRETAQPRPWFLRGPMSGLSHTDTGDCDYYGTGVRGIDRIISSAKPARDRSASRAKRGISTLPARQSS